MIPYTRDPAKTVPPSSVKIIGLGGAGSNMLERIALDGMEGTELCALNTDIRTLGACIATEKIQLGKELTKGLGAGGDPGLGSKAVLEAEEEIRASLKDHQIVFVCAGLGGGTGSGAAPIVTRIAREEGAFVVVFATTPFAFEGDRRREQAESALNELAVLSNALVTFDNNRMGELVLAKQGIHEAFTSADQMISESIKSVIRLVVRPGLINVGLDELMTALKTNRSRCLFGSGLAEGADRASKALRRALASPLLDEGALLQETQSVLLHLCGGEDLTLFEVELLMQHLQKHVPEKAQLLFGAAIDPAMGGSLSVTLISALPEESLSKAPRKSISQAEDDSPLVSKDKPAPTPAAKEQAKAQPAAETKPKPPAKTKPEPAPESKPEPKPEPQDLTAATHPGLFDEDRPFAEPEPQADSQPKPQPESANKSGEGAAPKSSKPGEERQDPLGEPGKPEAKPEDEAKTMPAAPELQDRLAQEDDEPESPTKESGPQPESELKPVADVAQPAEAREPKPDTTSRPAPAAPVAASDGDEIDKQVPKLKLGAKPGGDNQNELSLDSSPRGRFEGEDPNVLDGEDLDLPPFLRKKK